MKTQCFMASAVAVLLAAGAASAHDSDKMKMMDTNNDGKISAAEHAAGAQKMFAKMDADKDGRVTATEMDAAHSQMKGANKGSKMSSSDKIGKIDTDGDGTITAAEHEAGSRAMFDEMDADHDGYLTAAEMETGHQRMMGGKSR